MIKRGLRLSLAALCLACGLSAMAGNGIGFRWGSTDVSYPMDKKPVELAKSAFAFPAWRGERVNAQAVLWTDKDLSGARLTVGDLRRGTSVIPAASVRANFLSYVIADNVDLTKPGQCGYRLDKAEWDSLMVADVISDAEVVDVKAGNVQPVWLSVRVPSDAKPGRYVGTLGVKADGMESMTLKVELEVLDRTLPEPGDWKFHLDLWQNPYSVARYYKVPLWSEAHFEAMRPIMRRLAEAGQKVITATLLDRPWNGQTEDAFGPMVTKIKRADGTWLYDYTVFDKWVEFMLGLGIDKQINCYSMIPWSLEFDYYDQAANSLTSVKAGTDSKEYKAYWTSYIKDFARHLREKGWFDKTMIAMDERPLDAMLEALDIIKGVEPGFKVSLAGNYHPEIEGDLDDLCLAFGQEFPADVKAARERSGKVSTVYTCCAETRPNTFLDSPLAEAAWIGWHAFAKNYDGYLRWAFNSWTEDPLRDTRFRTWPAGDCFLVYPRNQSSPRFERLIEGIQDYEKARITREEWQAKGDNKNLARLDAALARFNPEALSAEGASLAVSEARKVVNHR